jgi:hypothetical protein
MSATPYGVLDKIKNNPNYDAYVAIYDLLNTQEGLRVCRNLLRTLGMRVKTGQEFHDELRDVERKMGLMDVIYLPSTFSSSKFLDVLKDKKAIIDIGANEMTNGRHGINTHRLQWWLVYQAAHQGSIKVDVAKVGDLYEALGTSPIRDVKVPKVSGDGDWYVWDDLFDLQTASAGYKNQKTFGFPEYLCSTWINSKEQSFSVQVDTKELAELQAQAVTTGVQFPKSAVVMVARDPKAARKGPEATKQYLGFANAFADAEKLAKKGQLTK